MYRELPPTAGLPLQWHDFIPKNKVTLEASLSTFLEVDTVQIECSGAACIVIALEALKTLSNRTTVIIPAYTCPVVVRAIARTGLNIVLCDTRIDCFDFDQAMLDELVNSETLCVVVTHLAGLACDVDSVLQICRDRGAWVIEDAAQALGATSKNQHVGTIADIGIFSLSRGKGLTVYEGGALASNNRILSGLLKLTADKLHAHERFVELIRLLQLVGYRICYNPIGLFFMYGMSLRYWLSKGDQIRAVEDNFPEKVPLHQMSAYRKSVGQSALERLPAFLTANRERGKRRAAQLNQIPGIRVLVEPDGSTGSWPFLVVVFSSEQERDLALRELWSAGLGVSRLFVHELTGYNYLEKIVPRALMPNAQSLSSRSLIISNSSMLLDRDFTRIEEAIKSVTCEPTRRVSRSIGAQGI